MIFINQCMYSILLLPLQKTNVNKNQQKQLRMIELNPVSKLIKKIVISQPAPSP